MPASYPSPLPSQDYYERNFPRRPLPSLPSRESIPDYRPSGRIYSAGPSRNEADQLSGFTRSTNLGSFSPWRLHQQDSAYGRDVASNVSQIANDRSEPRYRAFRAANPLDGGPPIPPPFAPSQVPSGMFANPLTTSEQQGRPAPPAPPVPSVRVPPPTRQNPPIQPAPVAPLPERVPPVPTPFRGSVTPNWRLRAGGPPPQMAANLTPTTPAANPPMPPPMAHDAMRQALVGNLDRQFEEARKAGDMDAMRAAAAQRHSLDQGGYLAMDQYAHESAMNAANRDLAGAKTGSLQSRSGVGTDPDIAYQMTFNRTQGDRNAATQAATHARMANAQAEARKTGKPLQVDPAWAQQFIEQTQPKEVADLFGENGEAGDIYQLYHALAGKIPQAIADPRSDVNQAARHRARAMFGDTLAGHLVSPAVPDLLNPIPGFLQNLMQGRVGIPMSVYNYRQPAINWFNSIENAR